MRITWSYISPDVLEERIARDTNLYYMVLAERGTAKLQAAVS